MADRLLNFWGWGYADRFPNDEGRRALAQMASGLLGFDDLKLNDPPRLTDIEIEEPRIRPPDSLKHLFDDSKLARVGHTYGKAYRDIVRGFNGDFSVAPDLVARPTDEASVRQILDWCSDSRTAVVPFGGGTSVVGGVETDRNSGHSGAVSLDLKVMNRVLDVDKTSRLARIQSGALGPQLEAELKKDGLTLRHFPQSFEFSTLGGWIATRAGGHYATLYTHIDDLVASTKMISPSGSFETRTLPGSGAGPSPDRLVLGSEGALGVITEAVMRVRERPRFRATASIHFDTFLAGVEAARGVAQSGLYPTNCRLLDEREAALNAVTSDGTAVLIVAFESSDHALTAWMERALEICRDAGGKCEGARFKDEGAKSDDKTSDSWKNAFVDAPYHASALISLGVLVDTFETACTWDEFPKMHAAIIENVRDAMKRVAGKGRISCRFTHVYPDGPAPYYTFLAPAKIGSELEQWAEIKTAASETLMAHKATITHHHAVGRMHRPWYERQVPALFLKTLAATKKTLDPAGILNPGVLIEQT